MGIPFVQKRTRQTGIATICRDSLYRYKKYWSTRRDSPVSSLLPQEAFLFPCNLVSVAHHSSRSASKLS